MDLLIMIMTSMQGLCVIIPCALIECLLIAALIECYKKNDRHTGRTIATMIKAVAFVPVFWLTLVLVIGCFG